MQLKTQTPYSRQIGSITANAEPNPFCKHISKCLFNGKVLQHGMDIFTYIKGLLYKHIIDSGKQFLALIIPKSWKYTVLVETHDKLGHQGNSCTYCLIKNNITGREWTKILGNTLQIAYFAKERKPKFTIILYRWWKYQIDHSIK